jgi:hypothetical protein
MYRYGVLRALYVSVNMYVFYMWVAARHLYALQWQIAICSCPWCGLGVVLFYVRCQYLHHHLQDVGHGIRWLAETDYDRAVSQTPAFARHSGDRMPISHVLIRDQYCCLFLSGENMLVLA